MFELSTAVTVYCVLVAATFLVALAVLRPARPPALRARAPQDDLPLHPLRPALHRARGNGALQVPEVRAREHEAAVLSWGAEAAGPPDTYRPAIHNRTCRRPSTGVLLPPFPSGPHMPQTIAVLDFGSQYTQVIARRIRECQVFSKIYHFSTPAAKLQSDGVIGIVLSGGPSSVFAPDAPIPDRRIFEIGVPVLGICYGIQLMGHLLGGRVARGDRREYGHGVARGARAQPALRRAAEAAAGLEFARRQADEAAPGIRGDRKDGELALRRDRGPPAGYLRDTVPPRGLPHRARDRRAQELPFTASAAPGRTGRPRISSSMRWPRSAPPSARRASYSGCREASTPRWRPP